MFGVGGVGTVGEVFAGDVVSLSRRPFPLQTLLALDS